MAIAILGARQAASEEGRACRACASIAAAAAFWALGSAQWIFGAQPGDERVALAWLASAVLAGVALFQYPGAPRDASGRARTLVDALIVGGSALLIAWPAGLADQYESGGECPADGGAGHRLHHRRRGGDRDADPREAVCAPSAALGRVGLGGDRRRKLRARLARDGWDGRGGTSALRGLAARLDCGCARDPAGGRLDREARRARTRRARASERADPVDSVRRQRDRGRRERGRRRAERLRDLVPVDRADADRRPPDPGAEREHRLLASPGDEARGSRRRGAPQRGAVPLAGSELLRHDHRRRTRRLGRLSEPRDPPGPRLRARRRPRPLPPARPDSPAGRPQADQPRARAARLPGGGQASSNVRSATATDTGAMWRRSRATEPRTRPSPRS